MNQTIAVFCEKCYGLFPIKRGEAKVCHGCFHSERNKRQCRGCGKQIPFGNHLEEERLSSTCHVYCYPQRYHGCRFCGYAVKFSSTCWGCQNGFSTWLKQVFILDLVAQPDRETTPLECALYKISHDYEPKLWQTKLTTLQRPDCLSAWPGFPTESGFVTFVTPAPQEARAAMDQLDFGTLLRKSTQDLTPADWSDRIQVLQSSITNQLVDLGFLRKSKQTGL